MVAVQTEAGETEDRLKKRIGEYDARSEDATQQMSRYTQINIRYLSGQAGVLAAALIPGEPCPVCGAEEHPNPAGLDEEPPTLEQVKAQQALSERARQVAKEAEMACETLRVQLQNLKNQGRRLQEDYDIAQDVALQAEISEMRSQLAQIGSEKDRYAKLLDQIEPIRREIERLREAKKQAEIEQSGLMERRQELAQQRAQNQAHADQLKERLALHEGSAADALNRMERKIAELNHKRMEAEQRREWLNAAQAQAAQKLAAVQAEARERSAALGLAEEQNQIYKQRMDESLAKNGFASVEDWKAKRMPEDAAEALRLKIENFDRAYNEARIAYEQSRGRAKGIERCDTGRLQSELEQVQKMARIQRDHTVKIGERRAFNIGLIETIEKLSRGYSEAERIYSIAENLRKTTDGTLSGSGSISFEQYVQSGFFDQVLGNANMRLLPMTQGQFELRRRTDGAKRDGALTINVMDYRTGRERPVSTLSGGESFKAALALALGLSDIIAQDSGGIQIDTLFVDEGFGTLDSDSLEQAINVLMELGEGRRLVGIVSHVEELKQRIDRQIVVRGSSKGSTAELIVM